MRFVTVIVIWVVFLGGVIWFMDARAVVRAPEPASIALSESKLNCRLEITPTFEAKKDPFALDVGGEGGGSKALEVRMSGGVVFESGDEMEAGRPIVVEDLPNLVAGINEFLLQASPPVEDSDKAHGVRMRLICDGTPLADETFWAESGERVTGAFRVDLTPASKGKNNDH